MTGPKAIEAASVVVARDHRGQLEVLMLQRAHRGNFGGFWVFPGGKVDPDDRDNAGVGDHLEAFRRAAVREAAEECGLNVSGRLTTMSYWEPPARQGVRFGTWFFLADDPGENVTVDGGEIIDHVWITPADAHARRNDGDFELAPPTWITLETLRTVAGLDHAHDLLVAQTPPEYKTCIAERAERIAMWTGDAGYDTGDSDLPGPRHRLYMGDRYRFERT